MTTHEPGSLDEYLAFCREEISDPGDPPEVVAARDWNRREFPDGCELCGEPAGAEMGEFVKEDGSHVLAHAQCGIDAGLEMA